MATPGNDCFLWRGHSGVAEDAFEHGDAAADDDVIGDVLHNGSSFSGD